jgi:hypothetical protein
VTISPEKQEDPGIPAIADFFPGIFLTGCCRPGQKKDTRKKRGLFPSHASGDQQGCADRGEDGDKPHRRPLLDCTGGWPAG